MKIGLLVCDDSNKSFPHESGSYVEMFRELFEKLDESIELVPFDVRADEYPKDLTPYAGFLTTGSACSVYDNLPWIETLKIFLHQLYNNHCKYFGVCFGHQLIAESFGGLVKKAPADWMVGVKQTKILKPQSWMQPNNLLCNAISSHQDQILELPNGATRIGAYEGCANAMIKMGERFIGFQGHPEFKQSYALPLMESRNDRISKEILSVARKTFEISPDHKLLAKWIFNFFNERTIDD